MKRIAGRKIINIVVTLALVLITTLAAGCSKGSSGSSSSALVADALSTNVSETEVSHKFAMILGVGGRGDNGYNDEVYSGCEMASERFNVPFDYCEPKDISDFETQLRMYADSGEYDVIMACSTEHKDALLMVAVDYPEQKFCMLDAAIEGYANIHSITASHPEQHFLSGVLAGLVVQDNRFPLLNPDTNILGYAIGMDNPVSRAQASGYLAGAKFVNPQVTFLTNYIGGYNDPGTAKEIAMSMYERGADIVSVNAGSSSLGVFNAAKEKGKYVIGTSLAMVDPDHSLSTSRKKVEQFVVQEISTIVNRTWAAGIDVYGIKEGVCDYDVENLNTKIPADVREKVEKAKKMVIDGKLTLPTDLNQIDDWAAKNQFDKIQ
jgi:basic membrane protein A